MRKYLLGTVFGAMLTVAASSFAYSFPSQLSVAFSSGQTLVASSLEDLRLAVSGMLGAFDASGNVLSGKVATGSSAMFVSSAEKSSWNSKLDASAVGVSAASLSGGLVPLAQLPPVFDQQGLNVLAASVATNAGARFVSDAEKASWDAKLGTASQIQAANVITGSSARFVSDSQVSAWDAKLDASAVGATVAPLSGGVIPTQYLPSPIPSAATDSMAASGIDQARFVNPKQLHDNIKDGIDASASRATGTNYQAATAGFVICSSVGASFNNTSTDSVKGYVGSASPASILVAANTASSVNPMTNGCSVTFPVSKNSWYRCDVSSSAGYTYWSMTFVPLK